MIAIADLGLGNIASVANMLRRLGYDPRVCSDAEAAAEAQHIVVPGVGAFDTGMSGLERSGWVELLGQLRPDQRLLGICLGMQLLAEGSEEGSRPGLGLIPAHFAPFDPTAVTVPHMGWNEVTVVRSTSILPWSDDRQRYYFTHSYFAQCSDEDVVLALADHGNPFVAAYGRGSIFGVQFHPEKSHRFGMELLRNFVES